MTLLQDRREESLSISTMRKFDTCRFVSRDVLKNDNHYSYFLCTFEHQLYVNNTEHSHSALPKKFPRECRQTRKFQ